MTTTEHPAKTTSRQAGPLALLSHLLRGRGSGAPSLGGSEGRTASLRFVALTVLATAALLAPAAPASALIAHPYESQITEAGGAPFGNLRGLAVDSAGNLYASDSGSLAVDKFDSTGAPVTSWGTNGQITEAGSPLAPFAKPFGLAVDSSDNLWVTDPGTHTVSKFNSAGGYEAQNDGTGSWEGSGFIESLAFSQAAGKVFVSDSNADDLWGLEPNASYAGVDFNEGLGNGCCFIRVAADNSGGEADGDLYVAVREAVYRIHAVDGPEIEPGVFEYEAGQAAPFSFSAPYIEGAHLTATPKHGGLGGAGLAVDSAGNLYVAGRTAVSEFAPSGKFLGEITGTPTGPGGALLPFGELSALGVGASSGSLYVADRANAAIDVFGPGVSLPEVTSAPATAVTATSATLNGEVNPAGVELTECFFEYGETTAYGQTAECEPGAAAIGEGNAFVPVHADLGNLNPGAAYHYRLVAANENGAVNESEDQVLFTGASIDSTSVSQVAATIATLETEINPHGVPTTYRFEYDTAPYSPGEAPHGTAIPLAGGEAGSGEADVFRSAQVQGLTPSTTYHYRVVTENSIGTVEGEDHQFTTQGTAAASLLPDDRGWEMVTPPNKNGSPVQPLTEEGGVIQAAADGSAFTSVAKGPLGPESRGVRSIELNQWLSARGPAGWSTRDITTPYEQIVKIGVGSPAEYKFFSADLSAGLVEPLGATPLSPQTTERTPYRREANGEFVPLLTAANVPAGAKFGGEEVAGHRWEGGVEFVTATPDLGHVVLQSPQALTSGFQPGFTPDTQRKNLYELSGGSLSLISVLPNGEPASEAGHPAVAGRGESSMRGAISDGGGRVFFETGAPNPHLYLRDNAAQPPSAVEESEPGHFLCTEPAGACTIQLDEPQPGAAGGSGEVQFQAASSDGSRVFFTTASQLTVDSTAAPGQPDLYMCEITVQAGHLSCALSDLSVDPNTAEAASVQGEVSALDASGTHVYFAANGVLTGEPNARGEVAVPGACNSGGDATCNLYVYDTATHRIGLVAVLSSHDDPDWNRQNGQGLGHLTTRSSPNGRWFAFMSQRPLTGYDNRDAKSGARDAEVFLYDTQSEKLICASCNPTGARPRGVFDPPREGTTALLVDGPRSWRERWLAASIPGWTLGPNLATALYQSRYLSDSGRLFFNAADPLLPADTNGVEDVYQYEPPGVGGCTEQSPTYGNASGGCVDLISSGTSPEESAFLDASEPPGEPQKAGNDVFFLTASRLSGRDVDTAFDVYDASVGGGEAAAVNPPECAGDACQPPAAPPSFENPGTALLDGPGNLVQCPKAKVKKSGKCVARKHHKAKHKKPHKHKRNGRTASHNRGGGK